MKDLIVYLDSIGTLQPKVSLEIRPQVNGQLAKVLVSEGEWVKEGTSLFQIDPKPYAIKVREAEVQLAMDLADARAVQMKLKRFQELARKDLVAQTEWDDLNAQAQRSEGAIQLNEARLHAAQLDLERCMITSPVEGRVGKLDVHPGILVYEGQGESLAKIAQWDPLIVEFTVTEKEFPQLPQNTISIEIASLCGKRLIEGLLIGGRGFVRRIGETLVDAPGDLIVFGRRARQEWHPTDAVASKRARFVEVVIVDEHRAGLRAALWRREGAGQQKVPNLAAIAAVCENVAVQRHALADAPTPMSR